MSTTTHEARLGLALTDLAKQIMPNFMGTTKKYSVSDTTLKRRSNAVQSSRYAAASEIRQCITHV